MTMSLVSLNVDQHLAFVTLNRPEKLNALTPEMLSQLEEACIRLEQDSFVRVVILTGAGDRAFCVGADINAWSTLEPLAMWRLWIRHGHRIFNRFANLPQPVIAMLNGYTLGGGLELALCADLRVAATSVRLALPEVSLGTIPGWAGTQRLSALIGPARAKQMIFTGAQVDAERAEQWGLVNRAIAYDQLLPYTKTLAETIANNAPVAVQLSKQLINGGLGENTALTLESLASGLSASTADLQEGIAAFRDKRNPRFRGQ